MNENAAGRVEGVELKLGPGNLAQGPGLITPLEAKIVNKQDAVTPS